MANARWNGVRFPKAYVNVKLIKTDSRRELDPSFNETKIKRKRHDLNGDENSSENHRPLA